MELEYYGGSGFASSPQIGKYEVRYDDEVKKFTELDKAIVFFDNLKTEKALWNVDGLSELLSCYVEK